MLKPHVYLTAACLALLLACGKPTESGKDAGKEVPKEAPKEGTAAPAAEGEAATPVEVANVERTTIHNIVTAEAILFPVNQANVMPKISAPVRRISVNRGDHVRAGQVLATLEDRDLLASVQENKSLVAQAESAYRTTTAATQPEELTKAQTDVQTARQTLDAAQKLYDNRVSLQKEGALAQKLVDDAKVTLVQAQSASQTADRHLQTLQSVGRTQQTATAQAQVDAAKARYQGAQAQVSYAEIRSPINGVVSDRSVYAGEIAAAGNPIVTIVDISQVIARANLPVKDAATIRVGKVATITSPAGNLTGKVTVVSPAVDPNTTTVEVWVQAANPGEKLKPGITVQVAINVSTINDALVVPSSAILTLEEGGEKVMIAGQDSAAHEQKIEVGAREGDKVQILTGVKEGDRVITSGGLGLEDKAKVKVADAKKEDDKK